MTEQRKNTGGEIIRFALTGGICFLIEFFCLVALKEKLGIDTLIATPIAFLISVAVNYGMCVVWVWPESRGSGNGVKAVFLATSLMGLALNELLMFLFRVTLGEEQVLFSLAGKQFSMYMVNKAMATLLVMIWNFFSKRTVLRPGARRGSAKQNGASE